MTVEIPIEHCDFPWFFRGFHGDFPWFSTISNRLQEMVPLMKSVSRAVQRDAEGVPRPRGTVAGATEGW